MAKLGFKDFLNVDYAPGEDDLVKKNAKKRKQEGIDIVAANARKRRMQEDVEPIEEVLSTQQRLAKARKMKILAPRIALGRKRQAKRAADPKRLKVRAMKQARNAVFKKLSKGVSRSDMSPARRAEIEKRLDKAKMRIQRLAIKMLPKARIMDRDRRKAKTGDKK
tara:strand:- start:739 stop:1233 length:495 start_codon:yes stop_codon:yes gene_type:complete